MAGGSIADTPLMVSGTVESHGVNGTNQLEMNKSLSRCGFSSNSSSFRAFPMLIGTIMPIMIRGAIVITIAFNSTGFFGVKK